MPEFYPQPALIRQVEPKEAPETAGTRESSPAALALGITMMVALAVFEQSPTRDQPSTKTTS
jgi:hypothetical protein